MPSRRRILLIAAASGVGVLLFTFGAGSAQADECTIVPGVVSQCSGDVVTTTTAPPAPTTTTAPPASPGGTGGTGSGGTAAATVDTAGARRLLDLANAERRQTGAPALAMRADVTSIALDHSRAMAADGRLRHNDAYFTSATKRRLQAGMVGENVAMNPSVDDAHRRLMASPGHRANLLDGRFTVVGIAVVRDGNGQLWITQGFVQPAGSGAAGAAAGTGKGVAAAAAGGADTGDGGDGGGSGAGAALPEPAADSAAGPDLDRAVLGRRGGSTPHLAAASPPSRRGGLILLAALVSLVALASTSTFLHTRRRGLPATASRKASE